MSFSDRSLWVYAQDRPIKSFWLSQGINHTGDGGGFSGTLNYNRERNRWL